MSLDLVAKAIKLKLPCPPKMLLIMISDECNNDGYTLRGVEHFRKLCGWSSPSTFNQHISLLRELGLVKSVPRATTLNGRQTNITHVVKDKLDLGITADELKLAKIKVANKAKTLKITKTVKSQNIRGSEGVYTENVDRLKNNDLTPKITETVYKLGDLSQKTKSLSQGSEYRDTDFDLQNECNLVIEELDSKSGGVNS